MASRHPKRWSVLLIIREMLIKTTPHTSIKKTGNNKCWQGPWRKGNPCALLMGMQIGATTVENSMNVPQKIKNRTTI